MTREHDALRDLIAPVALGAAAPHETARVEAHARECAVCAEELASLRDAADVLAIAVPQHDPGPGLKASIMSTVRAEAAERAGADAPPARPRRPAAAGGRRLFGLIPAWPAVAALATVVALALAVGLVVTTSGGSAGATTIAMTAGPETPGVSGTVLYVPGEDTAVVNLSDLPPLDPGDAYQLWIIRDGRPTSAGLFDDAGPSAARTVATGLADADALAVTAQPATSRTVPEGPILVQAAL